MTTRSVNWRVVWTSPHDPIPGSPDTVARGAVEYQSNARAVRSAIDYLDKLSLESIHSDAIAKLADQMRTVRNELDRVEERVQGVGDALADYAEQFREYQRRSMELWEEADALKSAKDSADGDAAALGRHADRLGDSDEDELKRVEQQAEQAESDAAKADAALAQVREEFAGVVGARNTAAEILKNTLQAIDDTTPGKDSWWDKAQAWVNKVVTAVFEAVSKLIKAAVDLVINALKAIALVLLAVFVVIWALCVAGLLLAGVALLLLLAIGLAVEELRQNPDLMMQVMLTVAAGGLFYMALAATERATRPSFKDCDVSAAELEHDLDLMRCADACYGTGTPDGYVALSSDELRKLGIEDMLVDPESGFKASVYRDSETGQLVVAFAGTDPGDLVGDVPNDIAGGVSTTKQDLLAMSIAGVLANGPEAQNVTYTGHSLGGRLASLAAIRSGAPAVTFNPAGVSDLAAATALAQRDDVNVMTASTVLADASRHVRVYMTEGDLLNNAQEASGGLAPPAFGDALYVVHDPTGGSPGDQHLQASMLAALEYERNHAGASAGAGL